MNMDLTTNTHLHDKTTVLMNGFSIKFDERATPNTRVILQQDDELVAVGHYHVQVPRKPHWKLILRELLDTEQFEENEQ